MKRHFPAFLLIIPAGALVILLTLILTLNLDRIVSVLESLFLGTDRKNSPLLFYITIALVPVFSGALMGLVVIIISKKEDAEYQRLWEEACEEASPFYEELARYFDIIDASITKLRDTSEQIKNQAEAVEELGRSITANPDTTAVRAEETESYSVTTGESTVTNLRIVHPVDGLILQEPAPFPESHQKIWFFPRK